MANIVQSDYVHVESKLLPRIFYGLLSLAVLSLLISFAGQQIGSEISMGGHTDDTSVREVIIGNDVLHLPANMIRYPEQRRDGAAKRIDIYAQWPAMTGYSEQSKAIFNNQDLSGKLLFLSFDRRSMVRDMSGRFEPIYKSLIDGPGEALSGGLTRYRLPEKAGFLDEYLYVGQQQDGSTFVARCLEGAVVNGNLAPCDRDIHVGDDLVMMVRFSPALLSEWRRLDAVVTSFASSAIK